MNYGHLIKILGGGIWSPETDIEWGIWMAFNPWVGEI